VSKPAAIPFFGDAYLADTTHLTTEEHGAYFLLMLAAWRQENCDLPNDDRKLARIVGLSGRKWAAIKSTIMEFWKVENGRIFQSRLRKERAFVDQKSESNRKSASARWNKQDVENIGSDECDRLSECNAPPPPPIRVEEPNGPSTQRAGKRAASGLPCPDDVAEQVWSDFLAHRRKLKADVTETAMAGFRREADRVGWRLERAIEESILRGWRGFKADWVKDSDRSNNRQADRGASSGDRGPRGRPDGFTDAINDALPDDRPEHASKADGRRHDGPAARGSGIAVVGGSSVR
jgi:uncharacterized protein YdaU (DUF1376 family)